MIELAVSRLIDIAGGATVLADMVKTRAGVAPYPATIAQWKFRNRIPRVWIAPVLVVVLGELGASIADIVVETDAVPPPDQTDQTDQPTDSETADLFDPLEALPS